LAREARTIYQDLHLQHWIDTTEILVHSQGGRLCTTCSAAKAMCGPWHSKGLRF
jgi:hypothetical protein